MKNSFIKNQKQRIIALFFLFTFLNTFVPYNVIYANNNGPQAPEAASFEPVDATDMVNLFTGGVSYVLPLLNVPSPEGGYPVSLAYHAGIAIDQQSTWVGLGWNLNTGAIIRSVNGYPDDYKNSKLTEFFYDKGGEDTYHSLSMAYSNGASVGLNLSWGGNQGLNGSVSIGFGIDVGVGQIGVGASIGEQGASLSVGYGHPSGLSVGISASTDGKAGVNIGFDKNGVGLGIGISTEGNISGEFSVSGKSKNGYNAGMGITMSSDGVGLRLKISKRYSSTDKDGKQTAHSFSSSGSLGVGENNSFTNTISQGAYSIKQSGFTIPLIIPTPIGIFSFSYGQQKVKYHAGSLKNNEVTGPIHYVDYAQFQYRLVIRVENGGIATGVIKLFDTLEEAVSYRFPFVDSYDRVEYLDINRVSRPRRDFMDVYEVPLDDNLELSDSYNINNNNPIFPAYDSYKVQAQGLSGSIHAKQTDSGIINGITEDDGSVDFPYQDIELDLYDYCKFSNKSYFYFDNEVSTFLDVNKPNFNSASSALNFTSVYDIVNIGSDNPHRHKFKSNYIRYYTNKEILTSVSSNFLDTKSSGFNRALMPETGIGAYQVTAADGKTYHYSLPVYNHEIVSRVYGLSNENKQENQSYLEKRQLEPYATHWLLTAVTGPDYVDNGDGIAGDGDMGYWVSFDYGKWSDAFVWTSHPGEQYIQIDPADPSKKRWEKGRKDIYYLDAIKTRTHTAIFVKSEDTANKSISWDYNSVPHYSYGLSGGGYNENDYNNGNIFNIPSHNSLKLFKILLFQNKDTDNFSKLTWSPSPPHIDISFNSSEKPSYRATYNAWGNVFDAQDRIYEDNATKVIELNQNYKLSNRQLTLNSVNFKGKKGMNVIPPYTFGYVEDISYRYDGKDMNNWGYKQGKPEIWSLNEIVTPQGGKININYEKHNFKSLNNTIRSEHVVNFFRLSLDERNELNSELKLEKSDISDSYRYAQTVKPIFEKDDIKVHLRTEDFIPVKYRFGGGTNERSINLHSISKRYYLKFVGTKKKLEGVTVGDKVDIKFINRNIYFDVPNGHNKAISYYFLYDGSATVITKTSDNEFLCKLDTDAEIRDHLEGERFTNFINKKMSFEIRPSGNYSSAGIRVASISTSGGLNRYASSYKYGENENGLGWVSYLPFVPNVRKEIPYSTELPAPIPMYEYVTVRSKSTSDVVSHKTQYHFKVLKNKIENEIQYGDFYGIKINEDQATGNGKRISINEYIVEDNLNCLGQLLSVTNFNSEDQVLNKVENHYYVPDNLPESGSGKLGVVEESYMSFKEEIHANSKTWNVNSVIRRKYPSILKSSTETKGGVSYTTKFENFDEVSGQAKETYSYSSTGEALKTVSKPAFRIYSKMGSKADDITNKNMLSQGYYSVSYIKDKERDWRAYSAEVQTWKDWDSNVWRKEKNYVWNGDIDTEGLYVDFQEPIGGILSTDWQVVSENTKYNHYSKLLEVKDVNGNYASTKMCDNQTKTLAVCNAKYEDMYYTGMEYNSESGITLNKTASVNNYNYQDAHTGTKYLVSTGKDAILEVTVPSVDSHHRDGQYKFSVWVDAESIRLGQYPTFTGGNIVEEETVFAGTWAMVTGEVVIPKEGGTYTLTAGAANQKFDDFRLYPITSSMTAYVYNEWDELSYIIGDNGLSTHYSYNVAGELREVENEVQDFKGIGTGGFKRTSSYIKKYKFR
ncbi:hypothetical protein ACXGQW_08730 [Wenyingzhuangia sp. IMCC45533]